VDVGEGASLKLVDMFCYLGDTLTVDGNADAAVEARPLGYVRNGIGLDSLCLSILISMSHFLYTHAIAATCSIL